MNDWFSCYFKDTDSITDFIHNRMRWEDCHEWYAGKDLKEAVVTI